MKLDKKERIFAVILAGGSGERVGRFQKQFFSLNGKPILFYSIDAFLKCPFITGIIIVVPRSRILHMQRLIDTNYKEGNIRIIAGGETRRGSSYNALMFIQNELDHCDYVIFHDGVRPLTSVEMAEAVYKEARIFGAAVLGSQALNVIVEVKNKTVAQAFNAKKMYDTQTPHCYRFDWILQAHQRSVDNGDGAIVLENIELVQALGKKIRIIDDFFQNMKLTFPQDIVVLESLLKYMKLKNPH